MPLVSQSRHSQISDAKQARASNPHGHHVRRHDSCVATTPPGNFEGQTMGARSASPKRGPGAYATGASAGHLACLLQLDRFKRAFAEPRASCMRRDPNSARACARRRARRRGKARTHAATSSTSDVESREGPRWSQRLKRAGLPAMQITCQGMRPRPVPCLCPASRLRLQHRSRRCRRRRSESGSPVLRDS